MGIRKFLRAPGLLVLLICAGATGCGDVNAAWHCGDGVAQGLEDCDGADLAGAGCADLQFGSEGTLACTAACEYDSAGCTLCGNGEREAGEQCDCGRDANFLPAGCTNVNGAGNCSANCEKLAHCGDGFVDGGEECDCGATESFDGSCLEPNSNTSPTATCCEDCSADCGVCVIEPEQPCLPMAVDRCCDDEWGAQFDCYPDPLWDGICLRACDASADCHWSHFCPTEDGSPCELERCVEDPAGGWPNQVMDATCTVAGGGPGWCMVTEPRTAPSQLDEGFCVEAGTISHGGVCTANLDAGGKLDRSIDLCDKGLCLVPTGEATGTCASFCNWQQSYDHLIYGLPDQRQLACPAESNCFATATVTLANDLVQTGMAYCLPTEQADPLFGSTTCSVVSNQLLSNPAQTCEDLYVGGRCLRIAYGTGPPNHFLVGVCSDYVPASKALWQSCDLFSPNTDICPRGSVCAAEDSFATPPRLATRCLPYCDTAHHDGMTASCADLGAPTTSTDGSPIECSSLSFGMLPGGPLDVKKTRLGLCAKQR